MEEIKINTPYIKLDQLLKFAGVVGQGTDAKFLIANGYVKVNGQVIEMRGKKIISGDFVEINYEDQEIQLKVIN